MEWDLDLAGVAGVLTRTQTAVQDVHTTGTQAVAALNGCQASASTATIVAGAIAEYGNSRLVPGVDATVARGNACVEAAYQAAVAYRDGDEEMAANAQAATGQAPDPYATMPARRPG